jgi:hypothetical protein
MPTNAPPAPTVLGTTITADYLVNNPELVQRTLRALVFKRLVGGKLLTGRLDVTGSGAAIFETDEDIMANGLAEIIAELAEYPLVDDGDPTLSVFSTDKYGFATDISQKLIKRNRVDIIARKLIKLANRIVFQFDARCLSAIGSAVTATHAATAAWNNAAADQLLDVLLAAAEVDLLEEGFNVDLIALKPTYWARLVASKAVLQFAAMPGGGNPILTGNLVEFAGYKFLKSNYLPGSVNVMLADSTQLGTIMYEDQGGGYQGDYRDIDGVESKIIPLDKQDGVRIQVRKIQEPVVNESGAAIKLTAA